MVATIPPMTDNMIKPTMNRIAGLIQLRLREDLEGDGEGEGKSGCCSSDIVTIRKVGERIALFYRQRAGELSIFLLSCEFSVTCCAWLGSPITSQSQPQGHV